MALPFWSRVTSTGYEGDLYSNNPETLIILAGHKLPGVSRVRPAPEHQVDLQKTNGGDGASLVIRGYMPGPIEIETLIWTPPQWDAMQAVIAAVWRKPGKLAITDQKTNDKLSKEQTKAAQTAAVDVEHPYLALLGITKLIVKGIGTPEPGPAEQSRIVRFKCIEYVPTPKGKDATRIVKPGSTVRATATQAETHKNAAKNSGLVTPSMTDWTPFVKAGPANGAY